jgi:hypothetical protein
MPCNDDDDDDDDDADDCACIVLGSQSTACSVACGMATAVKAALIENLEPETHCITAG